VKTDLLIIFYRNPELGKVKTRLAATVGDEKAFAIYLKLASHTREVALQTACDRVVYYSDFIDTEDSWSNKQFKKRLQTGESLGERMKQAFADSFDSGYNRVCIIGTDCLELTFDILKEAFEVLRQKDSVIGPAYDGGYYLLGMSRFIPEVFHNKKWSTDTVCADTLNDLRHLQCSFEVLTTLQDIDNESDLPQQLS
jgi:rSAM/selenodomain-associated transferase 1